MAPIGGRRRGPRIRHRRLRHAANHPMGRAFDRIRFAEVRRRESIGPRFTTATGVPLKRLTPRRRRRQDDHAEPPRGGATGAVGLWCRYEKSPQLRALWSMGRLRVVKQRLVGSGPSPIRIGLSSQFPANRENCRELSPASARRRPKSCLPPPLIGFVARQHDRPEQGKFQGGTGKVASGNRDFLRP